MYLIKMNRSCIFVSSSKDYSRRMCTHTRIYNQPKQGFVSEKAARTRKHGRCIVLEKRNVLRLDLTDIPCRGSELRHKKGREPTVKSLGQRLRYVAESLKQNGEYGRVCKTEDSHSLNHSKINRIF